jgi:hypothetical protein
MLAIMLPGTPTLNIPTTLTLEIMPGMLGVTSNPLATTLITVTDEQLQYGHFEPLTC